MRMRRAGSLIVGVIGFWSVPVLAQQVVKMRMVEQKDSLHEARERAHDDTIAFRADSAQAVRDSLAEQRRRAAVIPLTPALLATAFVDTHARALLARARAARSTQDSSLTSYDATTYERLSVGISVSRSARERLAVRDEHTSRVRWSRQSGAVIDITGARSAVPLLGDDSHVGEPDDSPIPYFPGRDALWLGSGLAKTNVSDDAIMNPLAHGAEAYYTYATGDSLVLRLSENRRLVVRELKVRPRSSQWNVVIGSLWFDVSSGQLVRAVYRLAEPLNVSAPGAEDEESNGGRSWIARAFLPSVTARLSIVTVDYGLFAARFWLPRTQIAEGKATIGSIQLPVQIQQHFEYASVNEPLNLPPVQMTTLDTAMTAAAYVTRDSVLHQACADTSAQRTQAYAWYDKTLPVLFRIPCDTVALAQSSTLPPSIYTPVDTLFQMNDRTALVNDALGLAQQGAWSPQRPVVGYGLGYTRYNRIEGLSTALDVQQAYGAGYSGHAQVRFGVADRSLNGELAFTRSNSRESFTLGVYRRLVGAGDWGTPFSVWTSLAALLYGEDDGIYYRTGGVELTHQQDGGVFTSWRLFAEHQFDAATHTQFSLSHVLSGQRFGEAGDINAINGNVVGLALERHGLLGEDPSHLRATSDVRLEGATGSFDYVRGMMEVTVDQPLLKGLHSLLTLSGGSSGGQLPTQRLWYLGGPYTVRGQPVASQVGDAYWFTRMELSEQAFGLKPFVFMDIGWAGSRTQWTANAKPMSGAGGGVTMFNGLVHMDIAQGVRPEHKLQTNIYLDSRF